MVFKPHVLHAFTLFSMVPSLYIPIPLGTFHKQG